jgi:hypothetical protein
MAAFTRRHGMPGLTHPGAQRFVVLLGSSTVDSSELYATTI